MVYELNENRFNGIRPSVKAYNILTGTLQEAFWILYHRYKNTNNIVDKGKGC